MNQQIIDYLQQNKVAYTKESLVQQLRSSGYMESDIQEAVSVVYGVGDISGNFSAPAPILNTVTNHKSTGCLKAVMISVAIIFLIPISLVLLSGHPYRHVDENKSNSYYYNFIGNSIHYVPGGNWLEVGDNVIEGVDKNSFKIISDNYAKDKNFVYFGERKIKNADPKSAKIMEFPCRDDEGDRGTTYYIKDAKMLYYRSFSFQDLDVNTAQFLEGSCGHILKDKNHVFAIYDDSYSEYYDKNGTYTQNMDYSIPPIEDADAQSFQAVNYIYAHDKNYVYSYGVMIPESDGQTLSVWGERYAKDKNQAYCAGEVLDADPDTFVGIDGEVDYSKDKDNVYHFCDVMAGADSATFSNRVNVPKKNIAVNEQKNKPAQTDITTNNSDKTKDLKCTWSNGVMTIFTYVSSNRSYQEVIPVNDRKMYTIQKDDQVFVWYSDGLSGTKQKTETRDMFYGLMESLRQNGYKCEAWTLDEKVFIPPENITFSNVVE